MQKLKHKIQEQTPCIKKLRNSFLFIVTTLVILNLNGCTASTPTYLPMVVPIPTIPKELREQCPPIKQIEGGTQQDVSKWIIDEIDQHSKCIIKSKATVEYLNLLNEYGISHKDLK